MRKMTSTLLLAFAGGLGLATSCPTSAHTGRICVGMGDVVSSYGRPHWRHNNPPLYVVCEPGGPRYYRYSQPYSTSYYDEGYRGSVCVSSRGNRAWRYDRRHRDRYDRHGYDRYERRGSRDRRW